MAQPINADFIKRVKKLEGDLVVNTVNTISLLLLDKLINNSPVDTGVLRAGWSSQLVNKAIFVEPRPDLRGKKTPIAAPSPQEAKRGEIQDIGVPLYITNGQNYTVFMDQGTPQQNGLFFIDRSLREMAAELGI